MHEGHRKRIYEKLKNGENFYEHEVLEMLLFNALPRKNTNAVAHNLLNRFPGMDVIFKASVEELCLVDGVGENVALYLKTVGECLKYVTTKESFAVINNYEDFKKFASCRFFCLPYEVLEIYCLDKTNCLQKIYVYSLKDPKKVEVSPVAIMRAFSVSNPHGIFVAHNHVSDSSAPSDKDDEFTKQMQIICSINNIEFYDHCIFDKYGGCYSYCTDGNLDKIKNDFSIWNLTKK